ncbi:ATP-binding protein [Streptomyces sp. NPDC055632]
MRAGYALDGDGAYIADARHHATAFLDKARAAHDLTAPQRTRDITALIVGELVTNACKYAPGPVLMELRISTSSVDIVVWDGEPTVPEALTAEPNRTGSAGTAWRSSRPSPRLCSSSRNRSASASPPASP